MHRNIQPFKRSGCPVLFSCFVRLNSTKTVFVRSFISICLGFLYVITHTEKNSVATWWAIGISLSTRMCCNGNNSVRLCFTSSDRCAHFVAVRIHITYSKIHCFPNNHHIYWVCCVFFLHWWKVLICSFSFTSCSCEHGILTMKSQCVFFCETAANS